MAAARIVLEPIFEADFLPPSYGFRPRLSAHHALETVRQTVTWGKKVWALDADIQSCFDEIDRDALLAQIERRVCDRRMWKLVRSWLRAGVFEGGVVSAIEAGTPQGSPSTAPTQWATWRSVAVGGGDRVADGDGVVVAADEYFAHDEAQDALSFLEGQLVEPVGEAGEEAFERLGELEVGLGVVQLAFERFELGGERGLALAQRGHPRAQLLKRHKLLLVGLDQALFAGAHAREFAVESLAPPGGGVLAAHRLEPAVDLGFDELGLFEQARDLGPDELVELVGADRARSADAAADVAVVVRADAAVVVDPALAGARRGAVAGVAALATDKDALQQRRLLGVAFGEVRVARQAVLRERKLFFADERRHRHERPVLGRQIAPDLSAAAVTLTPPAGDAGRPRRLAGHLRLAVGGLPPVGGVAQHPPHRRAVPHRPAGARRHALLGQPAGDLRDRQAVLGVAAEDLAHDLRLGLVDLIESVHVLGLLDVAVAVGGGGQHRLGALAGAMNLAAASPLADLRPLVLGDHPLELAQQLILRRPAALRLAREHDLHAGALELLQQQHLVGVAAREPIRAVAEHHLEAALGGAVAQPLKRRPGERRARDPLIAEHELIGHSEAALGGELTQPGDLTLDRALLALALRGHPRVDRRHPARPPVRSHRCSLPLARCASRGAARAPRTCTPAPTARWRACQRRTRPQRALPPCRSRA